MNYTQNHHLPQWDDGDRIMRTDFKQMCADIEAGLDQAGADTTAAEQRLRQKLLDDLTPLACDLYHAVGRATPERSYASHWKRIYHFPFATDGELADTTGMSWNGEGLVAGTGTNWSAGDIQLVNQAPVAGGLLMP